MQKNGAKLAQGGKVDLANEVKKRILRDVDGVDDATRDEWKRYFDNFE